jgi:hypothetical protein
MSFNRSSRLAQGCVLLALLLVHLYPGGLTLCVKADGSRTVEFGCNCDHGSPVAPSCACCSHPAAPAAGSGIAAPDQCGGCADFELEMRQGPATQLPAGAAMFAVIPQVSDLARTIKVPSNRLCPRDSLPPPLLAELQQPTVVIRV